MALLAMHQHFQDGNGKMFQIKEELRALTGEESRLDGLFALFPIAILVLASLS